MKYRKLRIAWSIACGVLCLLLIALWMRSYIVRDSAFWPRATVGVEINSIAGHVVLFVAYEQFVGGEQFRIRHEPITPNDEARVKRGILGFLYRPQPQGFNVHVPFWFLESATVAAATAPWIHWSKRFTLRTLLIGMSVIAAVLGLAIWASRGS
jgi:hypothetical protein